jgi:hypothetical protein
MFCLPNSPARNALSSKRFQFELLGVRFKAARSPGLSDFIDSGTFQTVVICILGLLTLVCHELK